MSSTRIGVLTPSSNPVVESVASAIIDALPEITAHHSRFNVTEISLSERSLAQFETETFLAAADLLADAKTDAIAWNGTCAAWRGIHEDGVLCEAIATRFDTPATASVLALNEILEATAARKFALVTPCTHDVQGKIVANYAAAGFDCLAEQPTGVKVNFDFSTISAEQLAKQVRAVAALERAYLGET